MDFSKAKGSKTLKAVAEKSASVGGLVVTQVDISKLMDNPDNEYLFGMKEEDIEHTARGIKDNGFIGAINVYKMESGQYEIYSGHIRRYAAEKAGMKKIPCLIEPMPDKETTKRRQLLGANLYGRNRVTSSDPILVARQLEYHKNTLEMEGFKGDMREQLALEFGISGSQVYKYLSLLGLTQDLQDMVSAGTISYSSIYSSKAFSTEKQSEIANKIKSVHSEQDEPLTREQVTRIISEEKQQEPIPGQMQMTDFIEETEEEECKDCDLYHNPDAEDMECHPETGDTVCCLPEPDEEIYGKRVPNADDAVKVYEEIGEGITNYYELKELLEKMMKTSHGYGGPDMLGANFSNKGVRISGCQCISLAQYMNLLSEKITLDKDKKSVDQKSTDSVSNIERKIYKLEEELSMISEEIIWTDKKAAKRIMKSLIALLTDQIEEL